MKDRVKFNEKSRQIRYLMPRLFQASFRLDFHRILRGEIPVPRDDEKQVCRALYAQSRRSEGRTTFGAKGLRTYFLEIGTHENKLVAR